MGVLDIKYKNDEQIFAEHQNGEVRYLSFRKLDEIPFVRNAFSTKFGGVSEGPFASMNLSYTQGDRDECVEANYRRMGEALGIPAEHMVASMQTHTTNIRRVTQDDLGKGIISPLDYEDVDGLITDIPGICLVTGYADCVPLYFVDPENKAIGLSHSGWKGTVGQMGRKTVEAMTAAFGSHPEHIIAAIGPSICQSCYEVSEDVIEEFRKAYPKEDHGDLFMKNEEFFRGAPVKEGRQVQMPGEAMEKNEQTARSGEGEKYRLNLQEACRQTMLAAGIMPENIAVTNACTCCNPDVFYSHRAVKGGLRGNLGAFLMIASD